MYSKRLHPFTEHLHAISSHLQLRDYTVAGRILYQFPIIIIHSAFQESANPVYGEHHIHSLRLDGQVVTIGISNREEETIRQYIPVCIDKFDNPRVYHSLRHFNIVSQPACCQSDGRRAGGSDDSIMIIRNSQQKLCILVRNT